MGKRWLREKRRDPWYRMAKKQGYRSRAAFKLQQIDDKYKVLGKGRLVVDLGASPGGWSQVAVERCPGGRVVGIDLAPVEGFEGLEFLRGDFTDPATVARLEATLGAKADTVLSDLSPNIGGAYSLDHARSIELAEQALAFAVRTLRPGGDFLCKVFEGAMFEDFVDRVKLHFGWVKVTHPPASRSASSEIYVVGKRFQPGNLASDDERPLTPQELAGRFDLRL